jgi:hypothetical protein
MANVSGVARELLYLPDEPAGVGKGRQSGVEDRGR